MLVLVLVAGAGAGLRVMTSHFTTSCYFNGDVFLVTSVAPTDKQIIDTTVDTARWSVVNIVSVSFPPVAVSVMDC